MCARETYLRFDFSRSARVIFRRSTILGIGRPVSLERNSSTRCFMETLGLARKHLRKKASCRSSGTSIVRRLNPWSMNSNGNACVMMVQ